MNTPKKYTRVITLKIEDTSSGGLQGKLLQLARIAKGYTQEELAIALGVTRATVAAWERSGVGQEVYELEEILGVEHGAFRVK